MKRLAFLVGAILVVLIGCMGGGGGGGGGTAGPSTSLGTISGKVTLQAGLASLHASLTKALAAVQPGSLVVFLEENPSITAVPATDGTYTMTGIPFGKYYVIARWNAGGDTIYKARSLARVDLTSSKAAEQIDFNLGPGDRARYSTRLLVSDPDGNPVSYCSPVLWGEAFTFLGNGVYRSPDMPSGAVGTIVINPPLGRIWQQCVVSVPADAFDAASAVVIGTRFVENTSNNHPPFVWMKTPLHPVSGQGSIPLSAFVLDPEHDDTMATWSWSAGSFRQTASCSGSWIAPVDVATASITFTARETLTRPPLSGMTRMVISNDVRHPGEVIVPTPLKLVEITGTATTQIGGEVRLAFVASITWPSDVSPDISWSASQGSPTAAEGGTFHWTSPPIQPGQTALATITLVAEDPATRIDASILMRVTAVPNVSIVEPAETAFEAGSTVTFSGVGSDYAGRNITDERMVWFVATDTTTLLASRTRTIAYRFLHRGPYRILFEARDENDVAATATKRIDVVNAKPVVVIDTPADGAGFPEHAEIRFRGHAIDYEDGPITKSSAFTWSSSIDGQLGVGTDLLRTDLRSGEHVITLTVKDGEGRTGAASIVIRVNMPPAMDFIPVSGAAFFAGQRIPFVGTGTDTDNRLLPETSLDWFLEGKAGVWQSGIASFTIRDLDLPKETNVVRLEGEGAQATIGSVSHAFTVRLPPASITRPVQGLRVDPGPVTFEGVPPTTGKLVMQWWNGWGEAGAKQIGTGTPAILNLESGRHAITYVGTDSGIPPVVSSNTITIIAERVPQMTFTPGDGAALFRRNDIPFSGTGMDTLNKAILPEKMKWLLNGAAWKTATGNFLAPLTDFPEVAPRGKKYEITLSGTGPFGTEGRVTQSLTAGIPLASITSPANNRRIDPGDDLTLQAIPDLKGILEMKWYRNYGKGDQEEVGIGSSVVDTMPMDAGKYTYTYIGRDALAFESSSTVTVTCEAVPVMDFSPADGSVFFKGTTIAFQGEGDDSMGSIPPVRMTWFIDSRGETVWKAGMNSFDLPSEVEEAGLRRITLKGRSALGSVIGSISKEVTIDYPLASITSPSDGRYINPGTTVDLEAVPPSHPMMPMEWWRLGDTKPLGEGSSLKDVLLPNGLNTIVYIGTDSQGMVSSSTIRIIVQNLPTMEIIPAGDAVVFDGAPCTLKGAGTAGDGTKIVTETMKWYRGTSFLAATETYSPKEGDLVAGSWNELRLEGQDTLGVPGIITSRLFPGHPLPSILSPANGDTFEPGVPFDLRGEPGASSLIPMEWWRDYDEAGLKKNLGTGPSIDDVSIMENGLHTIRYQGVDTFGNILHDQISILIRGKPVMEITPNTGALLFAGDVTLEGSGERADNGAAILGTMMKWYLDGDKETVWRTGATVDVASGTLPGSHVFELVGEDEDGVVGKTAVTIEFGYPTPVVTSPLADTRYTKKDTIEAHGTPNPAEPIEMKWWLDDGSGAKEQGTGPDLSTPAASLQGEYTLSYGGTDSLGREVKGVTRILVQDDPTVSFTPGNGTYLFEGNSVTLTGSGVDGGGEALDLAKMTWKRDGEPWKTGSPQIIGPGDVDSKLHEITLQGIDEYGIASTVTNKIRFRYPLASITYPADGTRLDTDAPTTFTAVPNSEGPITMTWFFGATPLGTGNSIPVNTLPANTLPSGVHTISYKGTDSLGNVSSSNVSVLVNRIPTVTWNIEKPVQYAVAPGDIPIFLASAGTSIVISAVGTDHEDGNLPSNSMTWYYPEGSIRSVGSTLALNIETPGTQTVILTAADSYGLIATKKIQFWVWDAEVYDDLLLNAPTGIAMTDANTVYVANASDAQILKLDRKSILTASGDLERAPSPNVTGVASLTDRLISILQNGSSIYGLETDDGDGRCRITRFAASNLAQQAIKSVSSYTIAIGNGFSQLSNPMDIQIKGSIDSAVDPSVFFIADRDNNRVVKWDVTNNLCYSQVTGLTAPAAVRYRADNDLVYIMEGGRIVVYGSDLNTYYTTYNISGRGGSFCFGTGATPKVYATDRQNDQIVMFDLGGTAIHKFGKSGTGLGEFSDPWGIIVIQNDLYVVERGNNRIQRIRGGTW